ncbi:MAG TPA: hypothetical protein P5114_12565 [Hyphomicrobiaceae bacterium]|nr:hypothetical protein [Hyphomicrobiaceae bacterium]
MRHETRARLDREIRMRRLRYVGIAAAILVAITAGFFLVDLDAHETKLKIAGTVNKVATYAGKGAMDGLEVSVNLDDGRHVVVLVNRTRDPHIGDRIEVTEHHHLTGRTTFTLR